MRTRYLSILKSHQFTGNAKARKNVGNFDKFVKNIFDL